jgi:hypothetical protein
LDLILTRAAASRPSGDWGDDDYNVLANGIVVGRIMKAAAKPADASWLWTLAYGQHEDSTPTHGYEATREAAHSLRVGGGRRETERGIGSESMTAFPGVGIRALARRTGRR